MGQISESTSAMLRSARENLGIGLEFEEWKNHIYEKLDRIIIHTFDIDGNFCIDGSWSNGDKNESYWASSYKPGTGRKLRVVQDTKELHKNRNSAGTSGSSGTACKPGKQPDHPYTEDYKGFPIEDKKIVRLMNYRDELISEAKKAAEKVKWIEERIDLWREEFKKAKTFHKLSIVTIDGSQYAIPYKVTEFPGHTITKGNLSFYMFDENDVCIDLVPPHGGITG